MATVKFFEKATTYGEANGAGFYWKAEGTDWVGPFEDADEAMQDADGE